MKKLRLLCCLAAFFAFPGGGVHPVQTLFAQASKTQGLGVSPGANLTALSQGKPEIVTFNVKKRADTNWLDFVVDIQSVTSLPLNPLRETLRDYTHYPVTFKRCLDSRVWQTDQGLTAEFFLGSRILGINYAVLFACYGTEPVDTEEAFGLALTQRDGFNQMQNTIAEWYLRRVEINGKPWTYCRFRGSGSVIIRYSLQEWIMTRFGQNEFKDLSLQLFRAVQQNNAR